MKKQFRSFEDARKFVHTLKIKSYDQWLDYSISNKKPIDIPAYPMRTYKNKGWCGMSDWLGNNRVRNTRNFENAKKFVHKQKFHNREDWEVFCKSGKKPYDIPNSPHAVYRNKGWNGWGDWLGTNFIATRNRQYRPFKEAREIVHLLGLKNQKEWAQYVHSGKKPDDISSHPQRTFHNTGWISWGDWLGTGRIALYNRQYRPFKEAREFASSLGFKSGKEWEAYAKSDNKPSDIPSTPRQVYKKEWKGMGDWLGTGRIADQFKHYRPFKETRDFVRSLGLKSQQEWMDYCKSGNKPDDIPSKPWRTYSKKEEE